MTGNLNNATCKMYISLKVITTSCYGLLKQNLEMLSNVKKKMTKCKEF